ncbi:hypothetical protein C0J52_15924 [Blattella germanica]|nr:hypothetical protein C0J52_15924 [Blattella germanica]
MKKTKYINTGHPPTIITFVFLSSTEATNPHSITMKFLLTVAILAMTVYVVFAEEPQQKELDGKRDKRGLAALAAYPAPYAAFASPYAYAAPYAYAPGFAAPYVAAPYRVAAPYTAAAYTYLA